MEISWGSVILLVGRTKVQVGETILVVNEINLIWVKGSRDQKEIIEGLNYEFMGKLEFN